MLSNRLQEMNVQPACTKGPDSRMPICTFKVCTAILVIWINVPAAASFVRYQRSSIRGRHPLHERSIFEDGLKSVLYR
jgi:hypothetical protein